jgi:hypothetical protein
MAQPAVTGSKVLRIKLKGLGGVRPAAVGAPAAPPGTFAKQQQQQQQEQQAQTGEGERERDACCMPCSASGRMHEGLRLRVLARQLVATAAVFACLPAVFVHARRRAPPSCGGSAHPGATRRR